MNRDRFRDAARHGFRAFLLSAALIAVYGIEYAAGWIPVTAFAAVAWLLLGITFVAVAATVPCLALIAIDNRPSLRTSDSLGGVPFAAEGRMARPAAAACSQELAHPGEPPSDEQDFQTPSPQAGFVSLCREGAPRVADQRDHAVATRGASQTSGAHCRNRPPE